MFQGTKPFVIAGPCGAESQEQLVTIAKALSNTSVSMIRAGVWKPRTKPGNFEGMGKIALSWLQEVKRISGLPVCTEVANAEQAELALAHDIDCLWIGARSTVNPFTVQEIADAIAGTDVAVMIKNPINPDVELWTGAIQRIQGAGIKKLAAIHRGFSAYGDKSQYRNKPIWAIPIELKRRFPEIPIFCDISHICGRRDLLNAMAQRAMNLHFEGLMIETHPTPDEALSDAQQQITPHALKSLLEGLHIPRNSDLGSAQDHIDTQRQIMDSLDKEIIGLLSKRQEIGLLLGKLKQENDLSIYQPERWNDIVRSRKLWGHESNIDDAFAFDIFQRIHEESIRLQIAQLDDDRSESSKDNS